MKLFLMIFPFMVLSYAAEARLEVFPTYLYFGTVDIGSVSIASVRIYNRGTKSARINAYFAGDTAYTGTNMCFSALSPGQSCSYQVTFRPDQEGNINGTLYIDSNDGGRSVSLEGAGRKPAE